MMGVRPIVDLLKPSVIILAFNSVDSLGATLAQAQEISDDLYVVDSFSTDDTVALSQQHGAQVVQHAFENYGAQRNWAIDHLSSRYAWQLHLDADERLTPELIASILSLPENPVHSGFFIARLVQFLGRQMRHGGMSPTWHLRLFRKGAGRCEERKYDQHFYLTEGAAGQIQGYMIDDIRMSLSEWTVRHNRWSDAEVKEQTAALRGLASGLDCGETPSSANGICAVCTTMRLSSFARVPSLSTATSFAWAFSMAGKGSYSGPCRHSGSASSSTPSSSSDVRAKAFRIGKLC